MSTAAAAILRDIYGANAAKKVARDFGVAVVTAKLWLAGRFPQARTQELAATVEIELARIEARNTEIRKQLGLGGGVAVVVKQAVARRMVKRAAVRLSDWFMKIARKLSDFAGR